MSNTDNTLMRRRAVNDANQLVIDHDAFADAEKIGRLADLVERSNFSPAYSEIVVSELHARAALVASMGMTQQK